MPMSDFWLVFQWWGTLFLVGAAAYPYTKYLFRDWFDRGFLFTKAVGMAILTYGVYLLAILHIAPFTIPTIWGVLGALVVLGIPFYLRKKEEHTWQRAVILAAEELFFFAALLFWTWIKAHEPSIHNLEKFMDFGFTKSILDSRYFPAPDMWYAGMTINYYYFGHTVMAVLTKLSGIDLTYTFNLMLATIFALTATMSFSIGVQLTFLRHSGEGRNPKDGSRVKPGMTAVTGGLLTAWLVTMAGNMQTMYAFTKGYDGDKVVPFWQLLWPIAEMWQKLPQGLNRYWYANATRFIPWTIHEFPSYSFVVSDVHGHVLSIPFVLLAIAILIRLFSEKKINYFFLIFYGFLCSVLLTTNALDGPIYFGLLAILLWVKRETWVKWGKEIGVAFAAVAVFSLPFLLHFNSFVSGLAVNCPPAALANTKIGPILFESVEKCQHSPLWMWWLLWGFFVYCGGWLVFRFLSSSGLTRGSALSKADSRLRGNDKRHELLLAIFFIFSVLLLIFPEFFYFKDIYPMHFRSNTMFKLGYQAFIMLSIVSGYTIVKLFRNKLFLLFLIPQLILVSIFPIFSVRSYFNSLKTYESIYGMSWFEQQYPDDWIAITWLNSQIGSPSSLKLRGATITGNPVIVEADGDSYTDYDRVSAFTGLPTIIGWPVHEWLWRGSYDVVSPRREEVRKVYESKDVEETKAILTKYHVTYIFVGTLEREKFKNLQEEKFSQLGTPVFTQGETVIYQIP